MQRFAFRFNFYRKCLNAAEILVRTNVLKIDGAQQTMPSGQSAFARFLATYSIFYTLLDQCTATSMVKLVCVSVRLWPLLVLTTRVAKTPSFDHSIRFSDLACPD